MTVAKTVAVLSERGVVCDRCELADSAWTRLRGLIGRARLEPGGGLMLRPASSIHTSFMRFPIDAVLVDRDMRVVGVEPRLRPWRWASRRRARAVLELSAGESERRGVQVGERLTLRTADGTAQA